MLSENLKTIAELLHELTAPQLKEINQKDANMVFAIGYAIGTLLNEASKLEKEGK